MSALLEKPKTRGTQSLPRPTPARKQAVKPEVKPHIHINARIIKPKRGAGVLGKCVLFAVSLGASYMVSSFMGQLLLEGARQERMEAKRRAQDAKQVEVALTAKLDKIESAGGIEDWALAHNFVAPESQPDPKSRTRGLVASR